MENYKQRNMK